MDELLMWLSAGGDIGVWVIAAVVWKFDRRLLMLETRFALRDQKCDETHETILKQVSRQV